MYVKVKELPQVLQDILSKESYGKVDIDVLVKTEESISDAGSDGRRAFAYVVNLATGESRYYQGSWGGANMFNPRNQVDLDDKSYPIPPDGAVVRGSIGQGTYATITVSPENVNPRLIAPRAPVSDHEGQILAIFKGLIPAARKEYLARMATMESEILSLVERGFIKETRAGARSLTTEGKNAAGKMPPGY